MFRVRPPAGEGVSHERKLHSYKVEAHFYKSHAQNLLSLASCGVPTPLHVSSNDGDTRLPFQLVILMTDLQETYPLEVRLFCADWTSANWEVEIGNVLAWSPWRLFAFVTCESLFRVTVYKERLSFPDVSFTAQQLYDRSLFQLVILMTGLETYPLKVCDLAPSEHLQRHRLTWCNHLLRDKCLEHVHQNVYHQNVVIILIGPILGSVLCYVSHAMQISRKTVNSLKHRCDALFTYWPTLKPVIDPM